MNINELYKHDLKLVPFSSYIDQDSLFEEYKKAALIPDLYLYFLKTFQLKEIDDNFPRDKLESARARFHEEIVQGTIQDDCKKPDISQTSTFKNLAQLSNSYDKFLEDLSVNESPNQRTEIITHHLSKLSLKNQLAIIDHILTDDTIPTAIKLGKIKLNKTNLLPIDVVEQRLEDFKNILIAYKNTTSKETTSKKTAEKHTTKFEDFFIINDLERLPLLKECLIKLYNGRTKQQNIAFALHAIEEDYLRENIDRKAFFNSFLDAPNLNSVYDILKKDLDGKNQIDYFLTSYDEKDINMKIRYEKIKEDVLNVLTQPTHEIKNNTA